MSFEGHISLIDLSEQFPFEIDIKLKKQICFGETLVISCGHYEGDIEEDMSDSEWSCHDTSESDISVDVQKDTTVTEIKDRVEEEAVDEEVPEEFDDFNFFFFSDCNKPLPLQNSDASLILIDGMPQINPSTKAPTSCACSKDKQGHCVCFVKLPCKCGAKTTAECNCSTLQNICICHEGMPQPVCTCKDSNICVCNPDGKSRPKCTCDQIDKPCICHPRKFPMPICTCKHKPKLNFNPEIPIIEGEEDLSEEYLVIEEHEFQEESDKVKGDSEQDSCDCQKPEAKPLCRCLKGKDCICNEKSCICGVQKTCMCEPTDSKEPLCKSEDSKSICSCPVPKECNCDAVTPLLCKCFPEKVCTCGDPEKCKCFTICECTEPCICDTKIDDDECICLDKAKQLAKGLVCTCSSKKAIEDPMKLKRVRAGKHGYRWCHEVDPRHTFFDYGYDRHDKISYKVQEREKVQILGLADEKKDEPDGCPIHGIIAPAYKKKVRKPSLDCCSAVGGISISVETLGEDKDKFLIQVVSHASKEGAKTGSKLVSIVDCQLHTMEENRTEYITKKEIMKERRSYMTVCENGYYNKVTRVCGERDVVKRFYHSFEDAHNFILEGANIVLLRYFGISRYKGTVKTETVLMDGTICESIYVCLGVSQAIVNGKPLFVVKVERHIIEPSGQLHQTLTILTLRGYTVSHEWADNAYILHLNPLLRVVPEKDEIEPHAPLREKWREDLQLLSDYLDFKSKRSSEGARYMMESGTLTGAVRDYLQALLMLRPNDALHFTRHYFGATMSALDLPHDEYFDPTTKHVRYYFFEQ